MKDALRSSGASGLPQPFSAYRNTIPLERQSRYPGDLALEERLTAIMRWNALVMVMRANQAYGDLGGHIASYAYKNRFALLLQDEDAASLCFCKLADDCAELTYLYKRRELSGGYMPRRERNALETLPTPSIESYGQFALASDGKEIRRRLRLSGFSEGC